MAFNVQLPNNSRLKHLDWSNRDFLNATKHYSAKHSFGITPQNSMYAYTQKIGNISPSLCFQTDVFYPNAIAAMGCYQSVIDGKLGNFQGDEEGVFATGCRGNQVQRDFPLESRVPVVVPLIQYPSPASDLFIDQVDICAQPVMNWEHYIEELKMVLQLTRFKDKGSDRFKPVTEKARLRKKKDRWRRKCKGVSKDDRPKLEDVATSSSDEYERVRKSDNSSDEDDPTCKSNEVLMKRAVLKKKSKTKRRITKKLFQAKKKGSAETSVNLGYLTKIPNSNNRKILSLRQMETIKNIPKLKLQSTWNYLFGGSNGACCVTTKDENIRLYVGSRTQVRQIVLEMGTPAAIVSYKVESVWEEDISNVPSNKKQDNSYFDPLSDTVFQIVKPHEAFNILGVRRGKSVELYSIEDESPYLLDSIPNICYGTYEYTGLKNRSKINSFVMDPLLLGLDFNPMYYPEFITIDENLQLRICDYTKGETISCYSIQKRNRPKLSWPEYPNFDFVNDAAGVQFGHHGQLFYSWYDSKVFLGDRRDNLRARASLMDIFDLRRSISSLSWSDQIFYNDSNVELNEYISSLILSKKENYYYVGTTSRIFLMDARVPGQPVMKLEHGMSTAAYMNSFMDGSYEVLVSGSQRVGETFSAITDHAHVKCFDRPECKGSNPVLHCLPRHLWNSRDFFDNASSSGFNLDSEAEQQRAKRHNYAWPTGIAMKKIERPLKDPYGPPGMMVFTSNCYGDVFYQEWEQTPIDSSRKIKTCDYKYTTFLKQWQSSMKSNSKLDFLKPSLNLTGLCDYSLMIEPSARGIPRMHKIRVDAFDAFKPDEIVLHNVKENQKTFSTRLCEMRKYEADIAQRCLDYWEDCSDNDNEEDYVLVKQEKLDHEFNARYGNLEWGEDGTREIEYLFTGPSRKQELIDLDLPAISEEEIDSGGEEEPSRPQSAVSNNSYNPMNSDPENQVSGSNENVIEPKMFVSTEYEQHEPRAASSSTLMQEIGVQQLGAYEDFQFESYQAIPQQSQMEIDDFFESSQQGLPQTNEMDYENFIPFSQPKKSLTKKTRSGF